MKIALEIDSHIQDCKDLQQLQQRNDFVSIQEASHIIAVGGDGFMLKFLQKCLKNNIYKPIYGLSKGSFGFLMNEWSIEHLKERLQKADAYTLSPLRMTATCMDNSQHTHWAFNDIYLWRQSHQTAKLSITIDKVERLKNLISDGLIVATPAGSTAYNYSAHGPILPLDANLLAMTPISPFRPRRWRGALLPNDAHVLLSVQEAKKRPVCAVADNIEVRNVQYVEINLDLTKTFTLLFDTKYNLETRILNEQFKS